MSTRIAKSCVCCLTRHLNRHTLYTRSVKLSLCMDRAAIAVEEQDFWWYYKFICCYCGKLGVWLYTEVMAPDRLVYRAKVKFLLKAEIFHFCWSAS